MPLITRIRRLAMVDFTKRWNATTMLSRRTLLKSLFAAAVFALPATAIAATVGAQSSRRPDRAPPRKRSERRPPARRGYVWASGYWEWSPRRRTYVWVPGRWVRARPGSRFYQARWVRRGGEWVFIPGGWKR
jgi:hypothetical protein